MTARIALRYAVAALVTAGILEADLGNQIDADPDILIGGTVASLSR